MGVGREASGRIRVAAEHGVRHGPAHGGHEVVAQGAHAPGEPLAPLGRQPSGDREGGDGGHVQGAGAHMPLLAAAVQYGYGGVVTAEEQRADPERAADLVPADRHGGQSGAGEVDLQLTEGLDRVGVHGDGELGRHRRQFTDRHDGADLVVGPHHGDHRDVVGVAEDRLAQVFRVDAAVAVDREVVDGRALVFGEPVDGVQDGVVFDGAGEDPGAAGVRVAAGPVEALHGEVVGLRAAGGEHHLAGACAEGVGEGFSGLLDGTAGPASGGVQ